MFIPKRLSGLIVRASKTVIVKTAINVRENYQEIKKELDRPVGDKSDSTIEEKLEAFIDRNTVK